MSVSHSTCPRTPRWLTFSVAALAALCTTAARADSATIPASYDGAPRLFVPTLGRPLFVEPGASFQAVAHVPHAVTAAAFDLVAPGPQPRRYPLQVEPEVVSRLVAGRPVQLTVPQNVPPQTYDLSITCGGQQLLGRHCVAVGRIGRSLRLVHLSNLNLGDAGAPAFDRRLIDEVNLVAPTLIVATGDFLDAAHASPSVGWRELVEQLTCFDAPLAMACGDHDDMELYSRYVAPSPVGLVNVGPHRALVLVDHPRAPIDGDREQLTWVERMLASPGFDGLTFVITHDDSPNLLRHWARQGTLARMIRSGRMGLWFTGGHQDWDGQAYRNLIDAAAPMVYLRTHQSSTAPRGGASGISHYRIIDVVDERVILPHDTPQSRDHPPSTPVGYLEAALDGPNDGSQSSLRLTAVNNLPYRLDRLAFTVRLRKLAQHKPWSHGAQLEWAIDRGAYWDCRVRFDLPDKGSLRALVGSGQEPPAPTIGVQFEAEPTLRFRPATTPDGLAFLSLTNAQPIIHLRNDGTTPIAVSPLARLDGDPLAYRPLGADSRYATAYHLRLGPGETVSLQLDLSAIRVAPGRRDLQLYLAGGDVMAPFCRTVDVIVGS